MYPEMRWQKYDRQDDCCLADEVADPHQEHSPGLDVEPGIQLTIDLLELMFRQLSPILQHEKG